MSFAQDEARRLNHNFVGTEHVLLGLIKLGHGAAFAVLKQTGLNLESVRTTVVKCVGSGPERKLAGAIPYTPRVKNALALARKESGTLNHSHIGTKHVLLGLLREGGGIAARVLKPFPVNIERTCDEILKEADPSVKPTKVEQKGPHLSHDSDGAKAKSVIAYALTRLKAWLSGKL